ncbi:MAG: Nif3-like dinuclear metal center hexameric protein [Tidjanibacter sp.]|nr:Nif3-like dinuclear metal center hexameric protein [Tidjanibacter sp.]
MKVKDIVAMLEAEVPLAWQESYDNAGLAVGSPEAEVEKVLLALDITEEVVDEAISEGAQMVVSHHPIIFRPIKRLADENRQQRTIAKAIRHGVALYAAHTNLDSAPMKGISHHLAGLLGVQVDGVLEPGVDEGIGIGVVGNLSQAVPTEEFLGHIKDVLGVEALRHSTVRVESVQRVAICSGSGGSLVEVAEKSGADVYISADFKYHDFVDADRMVLVDVGHFESEICAIEILFDILSKKITTFALRKSVCA